MRSDAMPRSRRRLPPDRVERLLTLLVTPVNLDLIARMSTLLDQLELAEPGVENCEIQEAFRLAREIAGRLQ